MKNQVLTIAILIAYTLTQKCHPECSWKCDDPRCDAICTPVCEPPKCHSSCQEPKAAICDVKCERPDCTPMCPDKACEMTDCPKCVNVCKAPHCVTHCQPPKPECESVCAEPNCDWKCSKPLCPKPKCELVCENPTCRPQIECCKCNDLAIGLQQTMFFKETEKDPNCCKCDAINNIPLNSGMRFKEIPTRSDFEHMDRDSSLAYSMDPNVRKLNEANYVSQESHKVTVDALPQPIRIGNSYYDKPIDTINRIEQPGATLKIVTDQPMVRDGVVIMPPSK